MKKDKKGIKTVELFAGVGGFRVGLNNVKIINGNVIEKKDYNFVFFNQWEPHLKNQHAYNCYVKRFNEKKNKYSNLDICSFSKKNIPNHDLLVGGFPCQDYSVARTLKNNLGIQGKKGVLWWSIYEILLEKKPKFVLLENVDRLLISPSFQKGRDFSIMLKCFQKLDYYVEWKVINAADYGMAQKRKRVFIFACKKSTIFFKNILKKSLNKDDIHNLVKKNSSFFTKIFKISSISQMHLEQKLMEDINQLSKKYSGTFYDCGFMVNGKIYTFKTKPKYNGKKIYLKDIILKDEFLTDDLFIKNNNLLEKIKYLKDKKEIKRIKNNYEYLYKEGKMSFPENLNLPGRTMLTSEGTINRSSHIIESNGGYRILDPIECERLNHFPDDWTKINGLSSRNRRYLMGNALVCEILKRLSSYLKKIIHMEDDLN